MDEEVVVKLEPVWEPEEEIEFAFTLPEPRGDQEEEEEDGDDYQDPSQSSAVQPVIRKKGKKKRSRETLNALQKLRLRAKRMQMTQEDKDKQKERNRLKNALKSAEQQIKVEKEGRGVDDEVDVLPVKTKRRLKRHEMTEVELAEVRRKDAEQKRLKRALLRAEKQVKVKKEVGNGDDHDFVEDEVESKPEIKARAKQKEEEGLTPEELRMKWREEKRLSRQRLQQNLSEEEKEKRRLVARERARQKRALKSSIKKDETLEKARRPEDSLTLEQRREKWREEKRQRRRRRTEEQRREENQRKVLRRLEKRANMTDEEKAEARAKGYLHYLQYKARMSDEALEEYRRKKRERAAEIREQKPKTPTTEEERAKKREYYRKKREKMTPEQLKKYREYCKFMTRKVRERMKADPQKREAFMTKNRERATIRRRARSAGVVRTPRKKAEGVIRKEKREKVIKKKSKGRNQDVTCRLSKRARDALQHRNRIAKELPEERVKRLLSRRLKNGKRLLRQKLVEEGASPERIEKEMEHFEANWEPKNRFLRTHSRPKQRSQEVIEELAKFGVKLEENEQEIDVNELVKIASTTALEEIKLYAEQKSKGAAKKPTSELKAPRPLITTTHSQSEPEPQARTSKECYYYPNNPVPYPNPLPAHYFDGSSASSYYQQSQSEPSPPEGPASPISDTSDFEDYFTMPPPAPPQPRAAPCAQALPQPSDKPRGKRGPPKGCKMRRNPKSNKGGPVGPRGSKGPRSKTVINNAGRKLEICDKCGHSYPSTYILEHNRKLHNPDFIPETGTCRLCDKDPNTFATCNEYYWKHWKENHYPQNSIRLTSFICEACGVCLKTKTGYERHQFLIHGEGATVDNQVTCKHCDKVFKNQFSLNSHLHRFHLDKMELISCLRCEEKFEFNEKDELKEHVRITHPQCFFPCEGCGLLKYSLRAKRFHYEICKLRKAGAITEEMAKERKKMEAIHLIPIKCGVCELEMRLDSLTRHFWKVHEVKEERFKCLIGDCTKDFKKREYWVAHMEMVHAVDIDKEEVRDKMRKLNVNGEVEVKNKDGKKKRNRRKGLKHSVKGRQKTKRTRNSSDEEDEKEFGGSESEEEKSEDSDTQPASQRYEQSFVGRRKSNRTRKVRKRYDEDASEEETPKQTSGRGPHSDIEKDKRLVISIVPLTSAQIMTALAKKLKQEQEDKMGGNETEKGEVFSEKNCSASVEPETN